MFLFSVKYCVLFLSFGDCAWAGLEHIHMKTKQYLIIIYFDNYVHVCVYEVFFSSFYWFPYEKCHFLLFSVFVLNYCFHGSLGIFHIKDSLPLSRMHMLLVLSSSIYLTGTCAMYAKWIHNSKPNVNMARRSSVIIYTTYLPSCGRWNSSSSSSFSAFLLSKRL